MLTPGQVRRLREPGKYSDGRGLYLHVITAERRSWLLRYQRDGKERAMGLGSASDVSLDEARAKAHAARKLLSDGIDPIDQRRAERQAAQYQLAGQTAFAQAADAFILAHAPSWKNSGKHAQQWRNSLERYAYPVIGSCPVDRIDVNMVLQVLTPIWTAKPETASRVRSRIENVLDYAKVRGWRDGSSNPATWRGNLRLTLPPKSKVAPVEHLAALDWRDAPAFMAELREREGIGANALQFAILTAARSGEVRGATWNEMDRQDETWSVPAARMKTGREHRVPLSQAALAILEAQAKIRTTSGLVFPGHKRERPMSDMTLTAVLRRMGHDLTAHGFRSTFRTWVSETQHSYEEAAKASLAHTIADKVDAAYQRGDLFDKRRALMDAWATYLARPPAQVIPLRRRA
jgi:integrase